MPRPVTLQIVLLIAAICVIGLVPLLTTADFLTPLAEKGFSLLLLFLLEITLAIVFLVYPTMIAVIEAAFSLFGSRDAPALATLPSAADLLEDNVGIASTLSALPPWVLTALRIGAIVLLIALAAGIVLLMSRIVRPRRHDRCARK